MNASQYRLRTELVISITLHNSHPSELFLSMFTLDCFNALLTCARPGFLLHTEDGVGPRGPMTLKQGKLMFTPLQTVWIHVDPHSDKSNLVSASEEVV